MIKDFHPIFIQHRHRGRAFFSPSFSILFLPFCEGCESKKAKFPGKGRRRRAAGEGSFRPFLYYAKLKPQSVIRPLWYES